MVSYREIICPTLVKITRQSLRGAITLPKLSDYGASGCVFADCTQVHPPLKCTKKGSRINWINLRSQQFTRHVALN